MQVALKKRLVGAAVLIALAVIVVPFFFSGNEGHVSEQKTDLYVPPASDSALETRTLNLQLPEPDQTQPTDAENTPSTNHPLLDQADDTTSDILSVQQNMPSSSMATEDNAQKTSSDKPSASEKKSQEKQSSVTTEKAATTANQTTPSSSNASHSSSSKGHYNISLGTYANQSNAEKLMQKAEKFGYPVQLNATKVDGKSAAQVSVGPFARKGKAEAAYSKLKKALPQASVKLIGASHAETTKKSTRKSKPALNKGWAVQLIAYSKKADADTLQQKLESEGYTVFQSKVSVSNGTVWRVRVGPVKTKTEAESLKKKLTKPFPNLSSNIVKYP